MKNAFLLSFLLTIAAMATAQNQNVSNQPVVWHNTIIPQPLSFTRGAGFFTLPYDVSIITT